MDLHHLWFDAAGAPVRTTDSVVAKLVISGIYDSKPQLQGVQTPVMLGSYPTRTYLVSCLSPRNHISSGLSLIHPQRTPTLPSSSFHPLAFVSFLLLPAPPPRITTAKRKTRVSNKAQPQFRRSHRPASKSRLCCPAAPCDPSGQRWI